MRASFFRKWSQQLARSRLIMDQLSSSSTDGTLPFAVHSTFRDKYGDPVRPVGLQWNLPGKSHVTYVSLASSNVDTINLEDPNVKRGIVEAHNLWSFAKEQAFRTVDDIESLSWTGRHLNVEWSKTKRVFKEECFTPIVEMIEKDEAAKTGAPAEVWVNGRYISTLSGPGTEDPILEELFKTKSVRLAFKRSTDGLIRIERYFGSYLSAKDEVFDHIMDNLIALEDIECIDSHTVIGTATLRDWIMGGKLTSRLWVRETKDRIRFMRPLHNDDISTSDRKFDLKRGQDDEKMALVHTELERLRQLAALEHPFRPPENSPKHPLDDVKKKLAQNRKPRKFFGM